MIANIYFNIIVKDKTEFQSDRLQIVTTQQFKMIRKITFSITYTCARGVELEFFVRYSITIRILHFQLLHLIFI